ncbi:hypothetical protein ACX6XY_11135 [Streptomyces sp. O3]
MPVLPVRRLATSALCATLFLGAAAPAIAAEDSVDRSRRTETQGAPVPGADRLLEQTETLGGVGDVLKPVTDLLGQALKADDGQLPEADAEQLAEAVKQAIDAVKGQVPEVPEVPEAPEVPETLEVPETPEAPEAPEVPEAPDVPDTTLPGDAKNAARNMAPVDLQDEALDALLAAVEALVESVTSGDVAEVATQVPVVLTGLVNFVVATLLGGVLPAPDLPGLPDLPELPVDAPELPETPELPVDTPELPVDAPELPVPGLP